MGKKYNMLLLILTILILSISITCAIVYSGKSDVILGLSILVAGIAATMLLFEMIFLAFKPYEYIRFETKYNTLKEIETSDKDVRDATFTKELIDINYEINETRKMKDNEWIGVFYIDKIAEFELLKK